MNLAELSNLDFNNPGNWPVLAKVIAVVIILAAGAGAGYWFLWQHQLQKIENLQAEEIKLREDFVRKQRVTANRDAYRARIEQMQKSLDVMLRQLPTRTQMPELLEDISNTGRRNGLNFVLFRPENEQPREFYAAQPIAIEAYASYHQFGAFVSSISALSRIVTLENASLADQSQPGARRSNTPVAQPGGGLDPLLIKAKLNTYRYLEEESQ